jgi:predicted RNA-binding Zn-ribbon protein involved in translation (DUF1610 family)
MNDIITRARALLAAATPGPWISGRADTCYNVRSESEQCDVTMPCAGLSMADAALIAAAPELIAALCDEAEASARLAKEAEAQAAEMRAAIDEARRCPMGAAASSILACALNVIPAGRAILDRLAAAEAERDALRAEVEKEASMRAEMAAEIKRLRARKARLCDSCLGWGLARLDGSKEPCPECGRTGSVIVESEK